MQHHTTFADVHFHCCQIVTLRTVNNYEYRILWWCYQHFPNFCKKCRDFVDCLPWFSCSSSGIACRDLSSEWYWLFHDYVPDHVVSSCGVSSFECLTSNVRDTVKHFNLAALKVGSLAPYILWIQITQFQHLTNEWYFWTVICTLLAPCKIRHLVVYWWVNHNLSGSRLSVGVAE